MDEPLATEAMADQSGATGQTPTEAAVADEGKYVYCIIKCEADRKFGPIGIGDEANDVGIDLVTVEARIVVSSIETYLKYAEAVGTLPSVSRQQTLSAGDTTSWSACAPRTWSCGVGSKRPSNPAR